MDIPDSGPFLVLVEGTDEWIALLEEGVIQAEVIKMDPEFSFAAWLQEKRALERSREEREK